MPKRPPKSGYAQIAQFDQEDGHESRHSNDSDDPFYDNGVTLSLPSDGGIHTQPKSWQSPMHMPEAGTHDGRRPQRLRAHSGVDIKAINARLEKWAEEIKERFTRRRVKGKSTEEEQLEIHHSVFQAPEGVRPATRDILTLSADDIAGRMSKLEFDDLIESVRTAIELGTHPKLISQGSSGSYFARNTGGKVVGVFKPKDEEPYANKNPKWTKWLHRNLLPFAFGRAMLIPNLSYVSEAAAYVLDCQLRTNLVPYTDVVNLSSKSFHYDWMERRAYYRKKRPFPEKPGSFQVFLKGFKGATDFFQEHPWPDQQGAGVHTAQSSSRRQSGWTETCRPTGTMAGREDHDEEEAIGHPRSESNARRREFWTEDLQQRFREELEKLVILDYIMRNTDRGTDNWMIRVDQEEQESSSPSDASQGYDRRTEHMTTNPIQRNVSKAVPRIGAIDNSLSWPWKHPDAWRSYPFGWLFLPVTLIGRPFSENTRNHFLALLTSKDWWRDTSTRLRTCFELDADFQEKMFARQMAVMKGQAWNVVETLKTADHGPLELTRRNRVLVWDDIVEIPVAIPLPRASEEMRSRAAASKIAAALDASQTRGLDEDEEMDISAALSGAVPQHKDQLLDDLTTIQERPNRNPFNVSRQNSSSSIRPDDDADARNVTDMPVKTENDRLLHGSAQPVVARAGIRPGAFRSRTSVGRTSNELPRRAPWATPPSERRRRFSLALGLNTNESLDDEGDLGYAAAAIQENSMRKVIVERLEVVKSRQPFFSWC